MGYCLFVKLFGFVNLSSRSEEDPAKSGRAGREREEVALCFSPLLVIGSTWCYLNAVSPASTAQGCHHSINTKLHHQS
jgi:hypothetical protein